MWLSAVDWDSQSFGDDYEKLLNAMSHHVYIQHRTDYVAFLETYIIIIHKAYINSTDTWYT